jgi:FkbM family methyltransferase
MALSNVHTHSFFADLLGSKPMVLDLGGNVGRFSEQLSQRFGATCVVVEPSPSVCSKIPRSDHILIKNVGISATGETLDFHVSTNSEASSLDRIPNFEYVDTIKVPTQTLASIVDELGIDQVDLLKVDIEGAEIDMIMSTSPECIRRFDQITVEFHDWLGLTAPQTVTMAIERLASAGFHTFYFDRHLYRTADVLFVRKDRLSTTGAALRKLRYWLPRAGASGIRMLLKRGSRAQRARW